MRISDWSSDVCSSDLRLCAGNASTIKGLLWLPASRIRANHPLKFCFLFLESDRRQSGVAYWHLTHQLPGVWICPAHNCFLKIGRAHVSTPVTNAHLVCRLLLEKKNNIIYYTSLLITILTYI